MIKNFKLNKLLFFLPLSSLMFCFNTPQDDEEKMKTIMVSVRNTLSYLHYSPKPINDAYSKEVYNKYFEMIDYGKRYFLQSDMKEFQKYQTELDNFFNTGDLTFYKLTTDRLFQRYEEVNTITQDILSKPIDFSADETFIYEEHKGKQFPSNKEELYNEWKKYIKYNILQEIETLNAREEGQRKKKDSVIKHKLKDTIKVPNLSPEEKMKKATNDVKDILAQSFRRLKKRKKMDWFGMYMNAHTVVFDPHSSYFSPKDKEAFDIGFTGKVIGIGAIIQEKRGNVYLGPLTVGAPAWKSKQLTEGDRILKVKSKPNAEDVNVVGMLADEVVRLIRGEQGTKVTLTVEKKDKSIQTVTMVREEVAQEDTYAKSIIINADNGKKYGLINLPSFNVEFDKKDGGRNASDDIKNELIKLKAQNISGVILDLRSNGGGSLTEVGDIMGLFMNTGPYVQIKDGEGKTQTLKNKTNNPIWTGSLIIMQNEFSASASEILAGAMQDYGRAIILGSPHSYGKGTVQTFVDLNRFLNTNDDFGSLKLTIQKFYRITGESNQRKGITSDIPLKDIYSYTEIGERYDDYALPWDKIPSSNFQPVNKVSIENLKTKSEARIAQSKFYAQLQEAAKWRENLNKEKQMTVQYDKFFSLMKERKAQIKKYEAIEKYNNKLSFSQFASEIQRSKKDEVFRKKSETWIKILKKDFALAEAVNVLKEM